jgi:hypothetical protein
MRMAIARRSLVTVALLLSAACSRSGFADTYVEGFDWHAHDPITYEDITVEATLAGVEFKPIDSKILDPAFQEKQALIGMLKLSDPRVLRGGELQLPISARIFFDWREIVGQRVVLCARWWPALNGYLVLDAKSVLTRKINSWERMEGKEVLADDKLSSLVTMGRQEEVARHAELIVEGVVSKVEDSPVTEQSKFRGTLSRVTMDEVKVLAGSVANSTLVFETYNWVARVPKLRVGERWIVLLQRNQGNWRVASGMNGLLKEGDKDELFLGGSAPLSRSKTQLVRMLAEVRRED